MSNKEMRHWFGHWLLMVDAMLIGGIVAIIIVLSGVLAK